ncbi:MAG: fibrobacter succinogenes major paralogous domain-containing protein [Fibrobacter sp.]|uniref:fibrobacter succinogenes major paralogous domain-containing protein n=1 Tax=Fibrobacter sp. TaxID=35828 RepID=UPI0025C55A13|nr:fibrobacter succinogenes major paralogous domain-containing protein [Fibrobacter sp.]MBQ9226957.1 fibrobacter succinogenes major paralogous domain-containing protein [Fibrobacter sp.]
MKNWFANLTMMAFASFLLAACGGDSGTTNSAPKISDADYEASSFSDLPACNSARKGKTAIVAGFVDTKYVCDCREWVDVEMQQMIDEGLDRARNNRTNDPILDSLFDLYDKTQRALGCSDTYSYSDERQEDGVEKEKVSSSHSSSSKHSSSSSSALETSSSSEASSSSSFSTPSNDGSVYDEEKNTLTDLRDGQTYRTTVIGSQTWMAENLNYETENSYCYKDKGYHCDTYGRLYPWAAAMDNVGKWSGSGKDCGDGKTCSATYLVRGVCPEGWRLPNIVDWETLITTVGGSAIAGRMLKADSGWNNADGGKSGNGTDAYSFSALPAGDITISYSDIGYATYFWSSSETDIFTAVAMTLYKDRDNGMMSLAYKSRSFSVRCLKDDRFVPGRNSVETTDPTVLLDLRDGRTYRTVVIGSQTWMAENLNYRTRNSVCYGEEYSTSIDLNYCSMYGHLYTWSAAMDSAGTWSESGKGCGNPPVGKSVSCSPKSTTRGVCPEGWHLPSLDEWNTLITTVGGMDVAGKMLMSTSGWTKKVGATIVGEEGGTDAYSFTALPSGYKHTGLYGSFGDAAFFWGFTEYGDDHAYKVGLGRDYGEGYLGVHAVDLFYTDWYSVRCVKD